jgi:hypothetical protein
MLKTHHLKSIMTSIFYQNPPKNKINALPLFWWDFLTFMQINLTLRQMPSILLKILTIEVIIFSKESHLLIRKVLKTSLMTSLKPAHTSSTLIFPQKTLVHWLKNWPLKKIKVIWNFRLTKQQSMILLRTHSYKLLTNAYIW